MSRPWEASWTEIVFSPSDGIPALGLLWPSRSEFFDRQFKTLSLLFSDSLISFLFFRVNSFSILKDISPDSSYVKLLVSTSSRGWVGRGTATSRAFPILSISVACFPLWNFGRHSIFFHQKCNTIREFNRQLYWTSGKNLYDLYKEKFLCYPFINLDSSINESYFSIFCSFLCCVTRPALAKGFHVARLLNAVNTEQTCVNSLLFAVSAWFVQKHPEKGTP